MSEHRTNCPNCGAPIEPDLCKCPYCGTAYADLSVLQLGDGPQWVRVNLGSRAAPHTVMMRAALMSFEYEISVDSYPEVEMRFAVLDTK